MTAYAAFIYCSVGFEELGGITLNVLTIRRFSYGVSIVDQYIVILLITFFIAVVYLSTSQPNRRETAPGILNPDHSFTTPSTASAAKTSRPLFRYTFPYHLGSTTCHPPSLFPFIAPPSPFDPLSPTPPTLSKSLPSMI